MTFSLNVRRKINVKEFKKIIGVFDILLKLRFSFRKRRASLFR